MSTTFAEILNEASEVERKKYQDALLTWLMQFDPHVNFAATLTMQPEAVQ
jgi:hypothetical protein